MRQRDSIELENFIMLKVARAVIRMKHALAAEREINEKLPELEKNFMKKVQQGELPDEATAYSVISEVYKDE